MSELSQELQELVLACKAANLPTEADSARVLAGLRTCLGDAAVLGAKASQVAASSTSSGLLLGKVSAVSLAGLALVGGIWFFTARNHLEAPSEANSASSVAAAPVEMISQPIPPPAAAANASNSEAAAAVDHNDAPGNAEPRQQLPSTRHSRDKLAEEVALLSRAELALHSGKPAAALEVLNEHERQFGNGILAEERTAARIQALCALGRKAEADAQLARLSPKSLHGAQAGKACGTGRNN
jgi:hypothetical protein